MPRKIRQSNDELVAGLKRLAEELGRTPTAQEIEHCYYLPSEWAFRHRFGSMNKALDMAGLPTQENARARTFTDEEMLDGLRDLAHKTGFVPIVSDIKKYRLQMPSHVAYEYRFGSFENALTAAGIRRNRVKFWLRKKLSLLGMFITRLSAKLREPYK